MKKFINKVNKNLLEKHPTIWNTKLVWMLSVSFIIHLLFFIFGFITLTNVKLLHERGAEHMFFNNGSVFLSGIISTLLIVVWLIYLFKNNAFKNFYPTKKSKLFSQFLFYIIIIFCASTFYISYNYGLKSYISTTYKDSKQSKEINTSNDVALFFSKDLEDYTINKLKFPSPFNELFCETKEVSIETDKPYFSFYDFDYQFYTLKEKKRHLSELYNNDLYNGFVLHKTIDSVTTYYYKDKVFDASKLISSSYPSYYNYSGTFFISKNDTLDYQDYNNMLSYDDYNEFSYNDYRPKFSKRKIFRNKKNFELLNRNDSKEIKQLLQDFLTILNSYKVEHNLTAEEWFNLIYHPKDFKVKSIIRTTKKKLLKFEPININEYNEFYNSLISDYYIDLYALHNTFENIEDIKESSPLLETIHLFMWFSFFLATIIFAFRVTDLKSILFTTITIGLLTLFIILITVLFAYITDFKEDYIMYFISYSTLILASFILSIPIFCAEKFKKIITSICLNISIIGFVLYLLLIITTISLHQTGFCDNQMSSDCPTLLNSIGVYWSFILFSIGLIFIYFYSATIKKWRALPEK